MTQRALAVSSAEAASGPTPDVVVIGAGIVGASCAYALARRGLTVHLVERDAPARGTSGACEGNLMLFDRPTVPDLHLAQWSIERWAQVAVELLDQTGVDIEFERKGSIILVPDDAAAASARERCSWLGSHGVVSEWLHGVGLHELEPDVAPDIREAAFFPADCQIEPRLATAGLVMAAARAGAVIRLHESVVAITAGGEDGHATVTTTYGSTNAAFVVLAAGVWSRGLLAGIWDVPIVARKGQIAVVSGGGVRVRHKVMEAAYAGTVSSDESALQIATVIEATRSGTILLGSSRLTVDPADRAADMVALNRIVARAVRFFPALSGSVLVRTYAGLRPMAPDHTPIVGPLPDHPSVLLATGHEGGGVMMAAATGELIAHHVLGQVPPLAIDSYLPTRLLGARGSPRGRGH